jgi:methylenetetrahydrofolate dehydrogenase (NADP+)/methenyltetrahydrofolate cyclohydrolase
MTATIIDGKAFAAGLREKIKAEVAELKAQHGVTPGLAVVLVGDNPASEVYVRNKHKACVEAGMHSVEVKLPANISTEALRNEVLALNAREDVHGILVQLPLPSPLDETLIINTVAPEKDVDGFHILNAGKLMTGQTDGMVPCTPLGCMMLLKDVLGGLSGKHAVVLGRSNIVGKPMAQLLLRESCTVTIAHSRTRDLPALCREADILVAAVGRPEMVKGDWIKKGAAVIDVGINRIAAADGKSRLVGDVAFAEAKESAGAITPVPGGVGPMTIACLLANTLKAARLRHGLPPAPA